MERVVQLLDEIDEVVGLVALGVRANANRLVLNGCLLLLTLFAVLMPF